MTRYRLSVSVSVLCSALIVSLTGTPQPAAAQERSYSIAPVAVTGEPAPGTGGLNFECLVTFLPALSESGIVAFSAWPDGADNCAGDQGIWVGVPGNVALAARTGDPAPGTIAESFTSLYDPFVNVSGDIAFSGRIDSFSSGLWAGSLGNLELAVRNGDPAPGTAGLLFNYTGLYSYGDLGVVSIYGIARDFAGGEQSGIWSGMPGLLEPVLLSGDAAPGTNGQLFADVYPNSTSDGRWAGCVGPGRPSSSRPNTTWRRSPSTRCSGSAATAA